MIYWGSVSGSYRGWRDTDGQKVISDIRGIFSRVLLVVVLRVLLIQKYRNDKNNKGDFYFAGIVRQGQIMKSSVFASRTQALRACNHLICSLPHERSAQSAAYHRVNHRYVLFKDLRVGAVRVRKLPRMVGYRGTEGHKRHKDIRGCLIRNTL